jgi:hypothetical protein
VKQNKTGVTIKVFRAIRILELGLALILIIILAFHVHVNQVSLFIHFTKLLSIKYLIGFGGPTCDLVIYEKSDTCLNQGIFIGSLNSAPECRCPRNYQNYYRCSFGMILTFILRFFIKSIF